MDYEAKARLARLNDDGLAACAVRLRAAVNLTGKLDKDFAADAKVSKTVLSNAMNGATYPNREVMKHLYRSYRIDFNFIMNGDFAQLPGDVQDALFPALEDAANEWDRKEDSGRFSKPVRGARSKT